MAQVVIVTKRELTPEETQDLAKVVNDWLKEREHAYVYADQVKRA